MKKAVDVPLGEHVGGLGAQQEPEPERCTMQAILACTCMYKKTIMTSTITSNTMTITSAKRLTIF